MLVETMGHPDELIDRGMEVERRAVVRYLCDQEVVYSPLSTGERLWARVRNISAHGIALLLSAPIDLGTKLVIEMKTVDPATSVTLGASVVHATMRKDGSWIVGCRFLNRPTQEQVLAFALNLLRESLCPQRASNLLGLS